MEMEKTLLIPNTEENAGRCLCPECPAHNQCMKEHQEVLYCSKGSSSCEFEKWGCFCPRCPVQLEYKTVGLFYCEKGAVKK